MHQSEFGTNADPLVCFTLIKESSYDVFDQLKRIVVPYIFDEHMKRIMREYKITKEETKSITVRLIDVLADSAPYWALYLFEYQPFYKKDGRPGLQIRNPSDTALTYDEWVVAQEEKLKRRGELGQTIYSLEAKIDAQQRGYATNPNPPPGQRPVRRMWEARKGAETTRKK